MKLVTHYVDPVEASAANSKLREAGVMTEVNGVDPHIIKPSKSGTLRFGLWVVFDDQFDDAVQLLENPDHVPGRKITLDEMHGIESTTGGDSLKSAKKLVKTLAAIIVGACLLGLIVYTASGIFQST